MSVLLANGHQNGYSLADGLFVGFLAVFGLDAVFLFGALAGISNHRMGHPVIPV